MSDEPQFRFRFDRALQAAAYLLDKIQEKKLVYIHLLKMLYIADREYLAEFGEMITGDCVCAMEHGPVLSCVYDIIKGIHSLSSEWSNFIKKDGYFVRLQKNPENGSLCRASRELLDDVFTRYGHLKPFEVVDLTHEFPEWQEYFRGEGTSTDIPWTEILRYQNKEDMIQSGMESIRVDDLMTGTWGNK